MDPRLLEYYNRELRFIREMGGEFAREFPKIAGRLGLESFDCADPYVERLLEGFAYLAARVQFKIDAEFPAFTQHLLEVVYPHYLAPTPSMTVVELQPDPNEGTLADGFDVPRDTVLRGTLGKGEQTPCEYRTAHALQLWPLELAAAEYFSHTGPVVKADLPVLKRSKAGIRLRLRTTANLTFAQLAPGRPDRFRLVLFLQGGGPPAERPLCPAPGQRGRGAGAAHRAPPALARGPAAKRIEPPGLCRARGTAPLCPGVLPGLSPPA